jgi:hypothetical protein
MANPVVSVSVTAGGSGYSSAPAVSFGGPGSGAAATAVVSGGAVVAVVITAPGSGYVSVPSVSFGGPGTLATALASVAPDLCTLAQVKAWLTITQTTEDTLLQNLVSAVSFDFLREIGRPDFYPAGVYSEIREGDGGDRMVMRHWPINSLSAVLVNSASFLASAFVDTDLDPERRFELYLSGKVFADGGVIQVTYNAGYVTPPLDAAQAVGEWTAYRYKSRQWIGQTSKHMAQGETVSTPDEDMPATVKRVIERYRRYDPLQSPPERTPEMATTATNKRK